MAWRDVFCCAPSRRVLCHTPQHLGDNVLPFLRAPLPAESRGQCSLPSGGAAAAAEDEDEESAAAGDGGGSQVGMFFDLFGRMFVLVRPLSAVTQQFRCCAGGSARDDLIASHRLRCHRCVFVPQGPAPPKATLALLGTALALNLHRSPAAIIAAPAAVAALVCGPLAAASVARAVAQVAPLSFYSSPVRSGAQRRRALLLSVCTSGDGSDPAAADCA